MTQATSPTNVAEETPNPAHLTADCPDISELHCRFIEGAGIPTEQLNDALTTLLANDQAISDFVCTIKDQSVMIGALVLALNERQVAAEAARLVREAQYRADQDAARDLAAENARLHAEATERAAEAASNVVALPKPVKPIPCRSKWRFDELVCGVEYCGAELAIVSDLYEWPAIVPSGKMAPVVRLEQKPFPAVLLCKTEPKYEWEPVCIEVAAQKKTYHPAKLELSA